MATVVSLLRWQVVSAASSHESRCSPLIERRCLSTVCSHEMSRVCWSPGYWSELKVTSQVKPSASSHWSLPGAMEHDMERETDTSWMVQSSSRASSMATAETSYGSCLVVWPSKSTVKVPPRYAPSSIETEIACVSTTDESSFAATVCTPSGVPWSPESKSGEVSHSTL